jgi:hypothetical protein
MTVRPVEQACQYFGDFHPSVLPEFAGVGSEASITQVEVSITQVEASITRAEGSITQVEAWIAQV